jgi:hypothetical protein
MTKELTNQELSDLFKKKVDDYLKSQEWAEKQEQLRIKRLREFEDAKRIRFTI